MDILSDLWAFSDTLQENINVCLSEAANVIAYADPRTTSAISVRMFLKPVSESLSYWQRRQVSFRTFAIADARKHELENHVEKAVGRAVRDLASPLRSLKKMA